MLVEPRAPTTQFKDVDGGAGDSLGSFQLELETHYHFIQLELEFSCSDIQLELDICCRVV